MNVSDKESKRTEVGGHTSQMISVGQNTAKEGSTSVSSFLLCRFGLVL